MTKAELEEQYRQYVAAAASVQRLLDGTECWRAVKVAVDSLECLEGAVRYSDRVEGAGLGFNAVYFLLDYAPLLLEATVVDQVETFLRGRPRFLRNSFPDFDDRLARSRALLDRCYRAWSLMESSAGVSPADLAKTLGEGEKEWRRVMDAWQTLGFVKRQDDERQSSRLVSHMDDSVRVKCPLCGNIGTVKRSSVYDVAHCPACRKSGSRVLVTG
jgi:hypothetical protein